MELRWLTPAWPRSLTAVMAKPIAGGGSGARWSSYSGLAEAEQERCLRTPRAHERDLRRARRRAGDPRRHDAGDRRDGPPRRRGRVAGVAVCHGGAGSEAETGTAFVKFAAARVGSGAAERFERLVDACEAFAGERGLSRLDVGMNLARDDAYRRLVGRGYRTWLQGVAMQRPNEPGYNRPEVYVIDDWR